jgi:hypothetical protein
MTWAIIFFIAVFYFLCFRGKKGGLLKAILIVAAILFAVFVLGIGPIFG